MPIQPQFVNVTNPEAYKIEHCHVHPDRDASCVLDIGFTRDVEKVIGLCELCTRDLGQALEPFEAQPDWVEFQYRQEQEER